MKRPTQRSFKDVETGIRWTLYMDDCTHEYSLVSEHNESDMPAHGSEVNGFYISAHTSVDLKIDGKKIIHLPMGSFYNMKEGEVITHKKFCGFSKFTKVKQP